MRYQAALRPDFSIINESHSAAAAADPEACDACGLRGDARGDVIKVMSADESNGYEALAERFMAARSTSIGVAVLRQWSRGLTAGSAILELGCGHGVPVSQALIEEGFQLYGVDASPALIAAFRRRFPATPVECSSVRHSRYFDRKFHGVVAVGLMFLLSEEEQRSLIQKITAVLEPRGKFLFSSPEVPYIWKDEMTGRESISLGAAGYQEVFRNAGLRLTGTATDEGENFYYLSEKE